MRFLVPVPQRQRGAVAVMVALCMLVLLAVVGIVVDGGLAYLVKARLNAAVDAAALAGARAVTDGANRDAQIASAKQAATDFFAANMPGNYMLSQPQLQSVNVTFNDSGMATIDVRAQAPMPVSIMQVMGFTSLTPVAYAQTIRRDLDMALVVDTSGSLLSSAAAVRAATKTFLNQFNVTQDRVALIHFASGVEIDNPISTSARGFDRTSMLANINAFNFNGGTSSVEGMWNARNQLNAIPTSNRSTLRVIVFFSDGAPTSFHTYLTFNASQTCTNTGTNVGLPIAGAIDSYPNSSPQQPQVLGLYRTDTSENTAINKGCTLAFTASSSVKKLPDWYNGHNLATNPNDPNAREFPIATPSGSWRVVTTDMSTNAIAQRNVDGAARNLVEALSSKVRDDGVFVFTLGLGDDLKQKSDFFNETGEDVLKCMANVADGPSRCYNPAKPVGTYCYAATTANLTPCFSRLASAILRISK